MHIEPPCFARTWASEFYMFRTPYSCLNCRYLQISLIGTSGISGSYVELRAWREVCRSEPPNHQWAKKTCRSERVHLFPFFFSVATMEITTISNSCALEVTPDDPVFVAVIRLCFWMFRYSSPGHVRGSLKPVGSVHFLPSVWLLFNLINYKLKWSMYWYTIISLCFVAWIVFMVWLAFCICTFALSVRLVVITDKIRC